MDSAGMNLPDLAAMRRYFDSGATRSHAFRREQLLALRKAILQFQDRLAEALYSDLHKGPEESYATETGFVLMEISAALKNLKRWMRPRRRPTNLLNFPSKGRIQHDPLGVVLIIAPWNYPMQLLLAPLVGAIAGGNCAVLKPSEHAPATAALLIQLIEETFPPSYIGIQDGDGARVVPALMEAFRFDHIFYTGSTAVGRLVYEQAARKLVPVTLELGGKSPAIVERDADIAVTARRIVLGKFANAGQTCVAPDYLLVHASLQAPFMEAMRSTLRQFFGEIPERSESYGRIINTARYDKLIAYLAMGRIVIGGGHLRDQRFIEPTVMEDVPLDAPMMTEEIFGPILPVYFFSEAGEAKAIISRNPDPLAFYIFTRDKVLARSWTDAFRFGGGCVNNTIWQVANHYLPFGGIGNSGIGGYHGKYSFERFTHAKPVMSTPLWFDPSLRYPPFAGKLKWFKKLIK